MGCPAAASGPQQRDSSPAHRVSLSATRGSVTVKSTGSPARLTASQSQFFPLWPSDRLASGEGDGSFPTPTLVAVLWNEG